MFHVGILERMKVQGFCNGLDFLLVIKSFAIVGLGSEYGWVDIWAVILLLQLLVIYESVYRHFIVYLFYEFRGIFEVKHVVTDLLKMSYGCLNYVVAHIVFLFLLLELSIRTVYHFGLHLLLLLFLFLFLIEFWYFWSWLTNQHPLRWLLYLFLLLFDKWYRRVFLLLSFFLHCSFLLSFLFLVFIFFSWFIFPYYILRLRVSQFYFIIILMFLHR